MRYQERIYIQNDTAVRNSDILNVNMSSDICVFEAPLFNVSGASKIDCTGSTGTTYIVSTATTIPIEFNFTGNTSTFTATSATFKYEIYKFDTPSNIFMLPPVYQSDSIGWSEISGTSSSQQLLPISKLGLDGEYLIKGYYNFSVCTDFLNRLGKKIDTLNYRRGTLYNLYDNSLDYYFIAVKEADIPILAANGSNSVGSSQLFQQVILPKGGETNILITNSYSGKFLVSLNGLILAPGLDFSYSGSIVTLVSPTLADDIITIIYTTANGNTLASDNIYITTPITSGITNGEGSNTYYYNTTTSKYEIYTSVTPAEVSNILVMLNGATLSNNIDYYQSISNPKRIILNGNLLVDDVITIVYFPRTDVVNGLNTNNPYISWFIPTAPQLVNGVFTLEVSTGSTFTTLYTSATTDYIVGETKYVTSFVASGEIGSKLYYRIKNKKTYITLCGDMITTQAYSETIPLIIQTNSINSY